ncbi:MAG: Cytochrome c [Planctomycetota bacterium]|nr:Cytochrome c [Planctomycetota bacterium]
MPATEETYRKQSTLHIVFAVSSIAMTVVSIWMIMADHLRPWKNVQRDFHQVETAKLKAAEDEKAVELEASSQAKLAEIDKQIEVAEKVAASKQRRIKDLDARINALTGKFDALDTQRKFQKAELDSQRSFYDGFIDRDERPRAQNFLQATIVPSEKQLAETIRGFEAAQRELARAKLDKALLAAEVVEVADDPPPGTPAAIAGFKKGDVLTVEAFDTLRKDAEEALKGTAAATDAVIVRRKIPRGKEVEETTLTLSVTVKPTSVKNDRDQAQNGFETVGLNVAPMTAEVLKKRREDLTRDLDRIKRTLAQKQAQYGEGNFLNKALATIRGLPLIDLAAPPEKIQQISLPELMINYNFKEVPRYDRCTTCHLGIDRPGYDKDDKGGEMKAVFHSHPHLTDGATAIDPKGNVVPAGLYLDSNGPHGINKFGCTICHGGQGSGTSFTFASHTPNTLHEKEEWAKKYDWSEIHHWDEPMLIDRFVESSCVKCHHQITDVPQAKKLQAGYERITKYGCTGCHTIGGDGAIGPDLTDNRQVGPNLKHLGSKVTKDWALKWIKNPHAFRPDTRMPRFYEVSNNSSEVDRPKVNAEIHAMTHYLFANSEPPKEFVDPPAKGDAEKGKDAFFQKGCMACHSHKDFAPESMPESVRQYAKANYGPNLSNIAAKFDEKTGFRWLANWLKSPEAYHAKTLMPNLQLSWEESADIARFLLSVKPDSIPPRWSEADFQVPAVDSAEVRDGLNELVALYLSKSKTYKKRTVLLSEVDSTIREMSLDDKLTYVGEKTISRLGCFGCHNVKGFETAKPIGTPLNGWGIKAPSKLDFGHIAEYLADHKELKDPEKAAGHESHGKGEGEAKPLPTESGKDSVAAAEAHGAAGGKIPDYDGTDEFYKEQLDEHTRMGFLYQKVHRPRSYDYGKNSENLKSWDDRLRMPQFSWANDPKAIEEVMTLILGLTGERIPGKYMPKYKPATQAVAQGEKLLDRYNCRGCHVLTMPKYTLAQGTKTLDALPDFLDNVAASYGGSNGRATDFLSFYGKDNPEFAAVGGLTFDPKIKDFKLAEQLTVKGNKLVFVDPDTKAETPVDPATTLVIEKKTDGLPVTIEGMPTGEDEGKVYVQLWRPVTIRGYTFNTRDILAVNKAQVQFTPAEGGDFAWLYATVTAEKQSTPFAPLWNRLPPPLLREGKKVQTPWLTAFLKDPYPIRPATQLRMPKFHYGTTPEELAEPGLAMSHNGSSAREEIRGETRDLANYFAARDGAEFPYQDIPERERLYLEQQEKAHKDYLGGGYQIITKGLCVQCHAIGPYKPAGGAQNVNGPDLRQVAPRFRPGYLYEWLAQPNRLVPYTAMPQNIQPIGPPAPGVPKSFEGKPLEQVRAVRDTLLNFGTAIEQQLAGAKPAEAPKPADAPAAKPAEGGQE